MASKSHIARALISVYDKTGVVDFARELSSLGVEIISTGGTAKLLRDSGVAVRDIADLTGWPEMLGGRVKTLHPKVHGGILYQRAKAEDQKQTQEHGIVPIDLVVVNLYPFSATAATPGVTAAELIENIDIGGPAMVRSAAKNFQSVGVVTDHSDYAAIAAELHEKGELSLATRLALARKAYARTARYDGEITTELERLAADGDHVTIGSLEKLPQRLNFSIERTQTMRYGENPHQAAALYIPAGHAASGLAGAKQLQGKELSYNNLVDLDSAWALAKEFHRPAVAIIKHNNPCGAAEEDSLVDAYTKALACDPISAFGGVLAFNRPVDGTTAEEVAKLFVECIAAPGYESAALEKFATKKNLRLLELTRGEEPAEAGNLVLKPISGGVLVQQADLHEITEGELKVVSERAPTAAEIHAMLFAWKVCKHVKSNAIVFAKDTRTVGIGAGQMSRVDSVKIAVIKAATAGLSLAGSVFASDAFFPFPDSVEEAAKAGATAVIQPGGSVRDGEVIAVANKLGLAMVTTGIRHFRH
ncbi:MAG: bifunctional phosphoribosylaminoimidazolecarboxamide formyltransferase/IMP cyclohydrolase [Candidatus Acidiferrales bacterium]